MKSDWPDFGKEPGLHVENLLYISNYVFFDYLKEKVQSETPKAEKMLRSF